jgi:Domain of unknown function (DUF5134)
MTAPPWLRLVVTALMIAIACGSGLRLGASLRHGGQAEPDTDGLHVLMGIAMAGMLEPQFSVLPAVVWQVTFAASAAWFGWKSLLASRAPARAVPRHGVPLPHLIESLAMIYMLLPGTAATPGMTMPGTRQARLAGSSEIIALLLALSMAGYAIWAASALSSVGIRDRRTAPREPAGPASRPPASRLAAGYQIAMGITMGYLLIQMA